MRTPHHIHARGSIAALMRATLGQRDDAPPAVEMGTEKTLPKMSVLTPQQRRAIFSKGPPPQK
jgi:hypothetical protein